MNRDKARSAWLRLSKTSGLHIFARKSGKGLTIDEELPGVDADVRIKHNDPHYVGFFQDGITFEDFVTEVESSLRIIRRVL